MRLRPTLALHRQLCGNLGHAGRCHVGATLPTLAAGSRLITPRAQPNRPSRVSVGRRRGRAGHRKDHPMRLAMITLLLAGLLGGLTFAPAVPSAVAAPTAISCATGWGSLDRTAGGSTMSRAEIVAVRAGTHPCFDRLVFDVNGPVGAYRVRYVEHVTGIASGKPVSVPGGARLLVTVFDPAGRPSLPSTAILGRFPTLRSVVAAGSFEGITSYGVGVRARLPFRVYVLPGVRNRIVLDVAHRW
jgi:hypothetical protein